MAPNTVKPSFQRRTIFIKKNLQIRYMVLMVACVLCGLLIMGLELTATLNDLFDNYPVLVQPIYDEFIPIVASFFYKIAIYIILKCTFYSLFRKMYTFTCEFIYLIKAWIIFSYHSF